MRGRDRWAAERAGHVETAKLYQLIVKIVVVSIVVIVGALYFPSAGPYLAAIIMVGALSYVGIVGGLNLLKTYREMSVVRPDSIGNRAQGVYVKGKLFILPGDQLAPPTDATQEAAVMLPQNTVQGSVQYLPTKQAQPLSIGTPYVPRVLPGVYDFIQEMSNNWKPRYNQIFLGRTIDGPVYTDCSGMTHLALAGYSGGGKTILMRMIESQLIYAGLTVYHCDITYARNKQQRDGSVLDYGPIEDRLAIPPLTTATAICDFLKWAAFDELAARMARERNGEDIGPHICIVFEEMAITIAENKDIIEPLARLLRLSRQYKITILCAMQDALVKTLGLSTGASACFQLCYYTGGDAVTARALLNLDSIKDIDKQGLGRGVLYMRANGEPAVKTRVPMFGNDAMYAMFNGDLAKYALPTEALDLYLPSPEEYDDMDIMPPIPMKRGIEHQKTAVPANTQEPEMSEDFTRDLSEANEIADAVIAWSEGNKSVRKLYAALLKSHPNMTQHRGYQLYTKIKEDEANADG